MMRAIDNGDIPSIRSMASRMRTDLVGVVPASVPAVAAVTVTAAPVSTPSVDIYPELQAVEDLLTGTEAEKREGLDRLHQVLRRLRPH